MKYIVVALTSKTALLVSEVSEDEVDFLFLIPFKIEHTRMYRLRTIDVHEAHVAER